MYNFKSAILVTMCFIAASTSVAAKDVTGKKNTVVADNEKFIKKIVGKNIKSINKEFQVNCDMKSYRWISIKWTNNDLDACEITGEISYNDSCGVAIAQIELIFVEGHEKKLEHNVALRKKDEANSETDKITSYNLKNIGLYMPRCESAVRVSNDYQLVWVDNTAIGKGEKMIRRIIE